MAYAICKGKRQGQTDGAANVESGVHDCDVDDAVADCRDFNRRLAAMAAANDRDSAGDAWMRMDGASFSAPSWRPYRRLPRPGAAVDRSFVLSWPSNPNWQLIILLRLA